VYGLAADGARGVGRVCELLKAEMETVVGSLGRESVGQLDRSCLRPARTSPPAG
jgi:isopentenyl diphosphate isomerase/L-lactate dehydrogenase-like FMN-dependent dehydrogenase